MQAYLVNYVQPVMNSCLILHTGVYLSLNGRVYANYDVIPITEIGETTTTSNTGLQCITDRRPCCAAMETRAGEWYFPNGTTTITNKNGAVATLATFYRNRGHDGTVNLNHLNSSTMSTIGLFCCMVPNDAREMQRICVNIGKFMYNILAILHPDQCTWYGIIVYYSYNECRNHCYI